MTTIEGKTTAPPYVFNLNDVDPVTNKDPEYNLVPLLTVGDEVPLLEGEFGNFTPSADLTYAMAGIPDGLGYVEIEGMKYVFMNHELSSDVTTDISSTVEGQINGARVSVFVFDENWNAIGGKNLIETVDADGNSYKLNPASGNYELVINPETGETDPDNIFNMDTHGNFTRFCSGYLAASGFVDENGEEIPIWFAPEETTASAEPGAGGGGLVITDNARSRGIAINAAGDGIALDGLGVYAKEQVYSPEEWRSTNSDYTVLLSTEDFGNGELYMYVGEQTEENPNGFTDNPEEFDLYVLKVVDPETGEVYGYETMPEDTNLIGKWTPVPHEIVLPAEGETGYDTQEKLSNWVDAVDENGQFRSTNFRRFEDVHEDPNNPNTFYIVSTGRDDIPEGSDQPDNPFGKLYRFTLEVDPETGTPIAEMDFEFLLEGGEETGVSYDNMVVDSNGNVLLQEDSTAGGEDVMNAQQRNGLVISYNVEFNAGVAGEDEVTFLFEIDQKVAGEQFDTEFGAWESSGIIEIESDAVPGKSSYLFDVQAHTIEDESGVYEGNYEQGGQLILAVPEAPVPSVELVGFAELPADTFAEGPPSGANDGTGNPISGNGRTGPFASQPVQGFSGVQFTDEDGVYWFLSDNGFGSKANSSDFLLRIQKIDPNFAGVDNGDGSAEALDFIQLADPNNLIPTDIVNEGTEERLLTGADLDPESIVIDDRGDIWIGDEFGPYILHFDSEGNLLEAPIATPNIYELNNLNGQELLVIGHRGASGELPEHTLEAYELAIEQGADFIEPDLVSTKDGVLIARHEPNITDTTDVADRPEFADRFTTRMVDGVEEEGWFADDFTLEEIKTLRTVQRLDFRDQSFNGQFEIPTLNEIIDLVQEVEAETGKEIGMYIETKHPTYFDELGLSTDEPLVQTLLEQDFTDPDRLFIQSFEVQNLLELKQELLPGTALENTPLVQLYDEFSKQPYDIVANFEDPNFDVTAVYGTDLITKETTYEDLIQAESLSNFVNTYAAGIGPWKRTFVLTEPLDEPVDANGDGVAEITEQLTGEVLPVVEDAHGAGLQVHPYTFRDEERYMVLKEDGTPQTPEEEFIQYIQLGVDGYFTDFPATGNFVREQVTADEVRSPDNPAVAAGEAVANLGGSRGFEGMAYSPDRSTLYPLLEGAVTGDPVNSRRIYEFDVATSSFKELVGFFPVEDASNAIGDFTPINENEFLVIERDNNQGEEAQFKKIYKIDISEIDEAGFVAKEEVVDLLNIEDPNDLNGDGETKFTFPFQTIEDVIVLDENTILVANDNNYPFSVGRGPDIDNNEMIILELEEPLDLDPALGENPQVEPEPESKIVFGTEGDDVFDAADPADEFDGNNNTVFAGAGNDLIDASTGVGNNRVYGSQGNDQFILGSNDVMVGAEGDDQFFVLSGGDNLIAGGEGADQFWIASAQYPVTLNHISDFEIGVDVIGIAGLGIGFVDLEFTQDGNHTMVSVNGQELAILYGIDSTELTEENFVIL